jgi:hypothetical protein
VHGWDRISQYQPFDSSAPHVRRCSGSHWYFQIDITKKTLSWCWYYNQVVTLLLNKFSPSLLDWFGIWHDRWFDILSIFEFLCGIGIITIFFLIHQDSSFKISCRPWDPKDIWRRCWTLSILIIARLYQHSLRSQDSNKPLRSTQYLVWNFGPNSRGRGCTAQSSISENFDSRIKSIFLFYSYFGYPNCSRRTSRRFITPLPSPHPQFCDWTITATSKMQILIRSPTIHFYGYFNYSVAWGTT